MSPLSPMDRPLTGSAHSMDRPMTGSGNPVDSAPSPYPPAAQPEVDIVFVQQLPEELTCPICEQALRNPIKVPCGHLFCQMCLNGLSSCKTCGADIVAGSGKPDKQTMKKIQALAVHCSYTDNGCTWTGTLKTLSDHATRCDFEDVVCDKGCGEVYVKKFAEKHIKEDCGKRQAQCEFCRQEVSAKNMPIHLKMCPSVRVDCPNQCGLTNQMRGEHLPECPKKGNACPFSEFGCTFAGEEQLLKKHIAEEPIRHLTYLCDGVVDLKMFYTHMQGQIDTMTSTLHKLQSKSEALEKLYGSQLVWRIDNFRQKQNEARSGARTTIFSTPFMTGRHGYKLIASVCPYGDGPFRGKSFSAYITIMRGDFDALLQWPFSHKVTFTLMDQNAFIGDRQNRSFVIRPNTLQEKSSKPFLHRPTSERNAAFGAQSFCPLEELDYFVQDDSLFLKINIDTELMEIL